MATVLYVDDEEAIRRAVQAWLTRRGHAVHVADSAQTARELLAAKSFDAIFIDLCLGTESGLELFQWIDGLDPKLSRRVTFVTGDPFDVALTDGSIDRPVLAKPFELRELEAQIVARAAPVRDGAPPVPHGRERGQAGPRNTSTPT